MIYTSKVNTDFSSDNDISDGSITGMAKNAWGCYNPADMVEVITNKNIHVDIFYRAYMSGYLTAIEHHVLKIVAEEQA